VISRQQLDRALNPRTVAVIGDVGRSNYRWLRCMSTFQGKVYSVQIDPKEIPGIEALGIPNYTSLVDIPDEVDYALVAVPRKVAPIVIADCVKKRVGCAAMFTSGFAETATEEGSQLQRRLTQMAREASLVVIGPNCMGLYDPKTGVRFRETQATGFEGDVTFLSQSGGHAGDISLAAHAAGVPVRKVISFGNGIVLESADYLEYFADDPGTRCIAMYIEGLRDGPRFFQVLRATARRKPVVLWKGGQTAAGQRATASHTASLAGSREIWDAMCRQAGAIQAGSVSEMIDLVKALRVLPPFTGDGLGVTGGSGGQSVAMADVFSREGLRVPALSDATRDQLGAWFSLVGASFGNPVDMGSNRREIDAIMDALVDDPNVDCLVVQVRPPEPDVEDERRFEAQIATLERVRGRTTKPVVVVGHSPTPTLDAPAIAALDVRLRALEIPTFTSYERTASVLAKVAAYHRFRAEAG